jgi:hypothetical protein
MRHIKLGIVLLSFSLSVWGGELYTPRAVLSSNNSQLITKARFDHPESGDLYLFTKLAGNIIYLTPPLNVSQSPIPFKENQTFQGEYTWLDFNAQGLPPGKYPLYQVVMPHGQKPNINDKWLQSINFNLGLKRTITYDRNDDGFADDDKNQDGFHDDDKNKDGYHDDDKNQDGYHDDDSNQDGLHDNPPLINTKVKVLPFSDLGIHCMNSSYSIFSILPPYNVINAQIIQLKDDAKPELLDASQVEVRYSAVADRSGSINSTSINKTDFWQNAEKLFGTALQPGEGLTGLYMPADKPGAQTFSYDDKYKWFSARGIPIIPIDDEGNKNSYPTLQISAYDKQNGALLANTNIVAPVSAESHCENCHITGSMAANNPNVAWAKDDDIVIQSLKNILIGHDYKYKTTLQNETPILCSSCHYSAAADLKKQGPQGAQQGISSLSYVLHKVHGEWRNSQGKSMFALIGSTVEDTCYQCHPGKDTQCQRGVMKNANVECKNCHGDSLAIAGVHPLQTGGSIDFKNDGGMRRHWKDLPRCQSCHTGDAVRHLEGEGLVLNSDGLRLRQAYKTGDPSASPLLAENPRFAENRRKLFKESKGHEGIACEACHGSTHAIWSNSDFNANDNFTSLQLQGHVGTIIECDTCHKPGSLPMTTDGPHEMHNVNDDRWTDINTPRRHNFLYLRNPSLCKACHGKDLQGTPLSKKVTETKIFEFKYKSKTKKVTLTKGEQVGCTHCHEKPS